MKGLIIKDLMCMKKQLTLFVYVSISVVILSIMFVLSSRFGNIHAGMMTMQNDVNNVSENQLSGMYTLAMMFFMVMPAACICDPTAILKEDSKAGFADFAATLPVPVKKRVLAKYIAIFWLFIVNCIFNVILSFVLSIITDMVTFGEFINIVLFLSGTLIIMAAMTIMFSIIFGKGKEIYASLLSTLVMFVTFGIPVFKSVIKDDTLGILKFPRKYGFIVLLCSFVIVTASYFVSAFAAQKKRGVV